MYKAVKGMNDIFGNDAVRWGKMESDIRLILSRFNYDEIRTPVVEDLALFQRGVGETSDIVQKEMYDFEDKKGRKLALRPEGTAGVVRAYVERKINLEKPAPHKLYYIAQNFRYERPQKGRYRQFHQVGIEVFGDPTAHMDAEVIYAFVKLMDHFNIKHEVMVNSIGCSTCRPAYREKLISYFETKKDSLCTDCQSRYEKNPLRLLDCKVDKPKERFSDIPLMIDHLCDCCTNDFNALKKSLDIFHVHYSIDPFIVRGLDYYTKTAFEIIADTGGAHNSIAGGGRYDNLVEEMGGKATPATGAAIGLERLFDLIPKDFYCDESLAVGYALFDDGVQDLVHFAKHISPHPVKFMADYVPRKMKNALKKADKLSARHVFIFGEDEVAEKKVLYKDMKTGEQTFFNQYEVMNIVDTLMRKEVEEMS